MSYKWKPNKSQRQAFALKMQDPYEKRDYEERKAEKRRYENWEHKDFTPTENQFNLCIALRKLYLTETQENAINMVEAAFIRDEKTSHDYIHIVNELGRLYNWNGSSLVPS